MHYQYSYAVESQEGFLAMILYYLVCALFGGGLGIVLYVFRSLGVYTIAKRRGLHHAWFAWVPVVDSYLLGCVSDQYRYVVKGQNKSKRKWLLGLQIVMAVLLVTLVANFVGLAIRIGSMAMKGVGEAKLINAVMPAVLKILALSLPLICVAVAAGVLRYMALYDLYTSCDTRNNVVYLVLSIFLHVTEPFFIFFSRNKDEGMPPRREVPRAEEAASWKQPDAELE